MKGQSINVLYISYDGMTDPLGQSQVLPYLKGLVHKGYNITLISCEKPDRYRVSKDQISKICADSGIDWQPVFYTAKPPIISTIKDISTIKKTALRLFQNKHYHIVHCRSYIAAIVGLFLKHKFQSKFVFDMRGFWPDERVDGNIWKLSNPVYKIVYDYFKKKEKQFLLAADHIICLTNNAKQEINSWSLTAQHLPITVIPCCVDTQLFSPSNVSEEKLNNLRAQLGINKEDRLIGYIGSIGTWYLLDEMVNYFKVATHNDALLKFLFLTNEPSSMIDASLERNQCTYLRPAIIVTSSPRKDVPAYISLLDYSVFFIKPAYSKKASSPTKQGEIMAMGKPVVCNAGVGDTDWVVNNFHSGVLVESFGDRQYAKAIGQMRLANFDENTIRDGAIQFFSLEKGVQLYAGVYQSLIP